MKQRRINCLLLIIPLLISCNQKKSSELVVPSPDMKNHFYFNLNDGEPWYLFFVNNDIIIDWSLLGVVTEDHKKYSEGLFIEKSVSRSVSAEDEIFFAEGSILRSPYNEIIIHLSKPENPEIKFVIILRVYNMGFAIGYDFESGSGNSPVEITSDETELNLYSKSTHWIVQNQLPKDSAALLASEAENISIPCTFVSDQGYSISVYNPEDNKIPEVSLVKQKQDLPNYQFALKSSSAMTFSIHADFSPLYKIFTVSNNN
ncbi:MAG: hypothetical protein FJY07_08320 [Bacteroidetes bacterium]|nr:hypothetical protein [Bacteroidota bacterium]